MRKQKKVILLTYCFILFILTGCWDSKELPDLNIISALAIDISENNDDRYEATVQLINPSQIASGQQGGKVQSSPIITFSSSGNTLSEALRKISPKIPGELFFPHIQVMIISEDIAKEGIKPLFDVIERDSDFRLLFPVLIAKDTLAKNILQITTELFPIPADEMVKIIQSSKEEWGEFIDTRADQVIAELVDGNLIISGVTIKGDKEMGNKVENTLQISPGATIELGNIAIFKKGHFVKWMNPTDTRGATWILNEMKNSILNVDYQDFKKGVAIEIFRSQTHIRTDVKKNQPIIQIDVNADGTIIETLHSLDLNSSKVINNLEETVQNEIRKEIENTIHIAQQEESDFLRLGEYINIQHKKEWKKMKKQWDSKIFPNTTIKVNVHVHLRHTGMMTRPI